MGRWREESNKEITLVAPGLWNKPHKIKTVSTSEPRLPLKLHTPVQEEEASASVHMHHIKHQLLPYIMVPITFSVETTAGDNSWRHKPTRTQLNTQSVNPGQLEGQVPKALRAKTKEPGGEEAFQVKHLGPAGLD